MTSATSPAMSPKFWEYFLNIEADLANCSRYVEFANSNFETYSNEFAQLIVTASSEIDAILRELCLMIDTSTKVNTINEYYAVVNTRFPKFIGCGVDIRRSGLSFTPWADWKPQQSPHWWGKGFTKIKHDRTNNFESASLFNALQAVGALFLVILHYHKHPANGSLMVDINRGTQLFTPTDERGYQGGTRWVYGLS